MNGRESHHRVGFAARRSERSIPRRHGGRRAARAVSSSARTRTRTHQQDLIARRRDGRAVGPFEVARALHTHQTACPDHNRSDQCALLIQPFNVPRVQEGRPMRRRQRGSRTRAEEFCIDISCETRTFSNEPSFASSSAVPSCPLTDSNRAETAGGVAMSLVAHKPTSQEEGG